MPTVRITGLPQTGLDDSGRLQLLASLEGVPNDLWADIYERAVEVRLGTAVTHMTASASMHHVTVSVEHAQQADAALAAIVEEIATANALWDEAQGKLGEFKNRVDQWWSTNVQR